MQRAELTTTAPSASLPMNALWRTIRGYILWQYERGTLHYDIMVTLILIFVFFSPRVINFNDKPGPLIQHPTGVLVTSDGAGGLVYQIEASTISATDDAALREQFEHIIEPISGAVSIMKYEEVSDPKGHVHGYRVWAKRK